MPRLLEKIIISEKRRIAMVASGGGLKAHYFHMGVGIRLAREGFQFNGGVLETPRTELIPPHELGTKTIDMFVGSSGGALFSMGVALGHSPEDMYNLFRDPKQLKKVGLAQGIGHYIQFNRKTITQAAKCMLRILATKQLHPEALSFMSPISLEPLEKRLHRFLETEDFRHVAADLFVVSTPLNLRNRIVYSRRPFEEEPRLVYRNDANISSAVTASCALQFLAPICVEHKNGDKIDQVDGETRKTLSYKIASSNGADLVFVSYTHVPYEFDKDVGSIKKYGLIRTVVQSVYLLIEEKILASQELTQQKNTTYDLVMGEFEQILTDLPTEHRAALIDHRDRMVARLVKELDIKRGVDYIFIRPESDDHDFYFDWHLGMSTDYVEKMVRKGYEAADRELRKFDFKFLK
ncbi:hypothetical protein HN587_02580 [Candidatus Woesearchaeota archaeon]|jgi:predicted acylesterase/phospholipase RssA|nr:hypothetical protein [Candidatus Woesearchaeota archaeon]